jgi:drug/metabolite transporter (DMT)-like permease
MYRYNNDTFRVASFHANTIPVFTAALAFLFLGEKFPAVLQHHTWRSR